MKPRGNLFPVLLVAGGLAFGIGIIIVSLFANRQHWDRNTAFSAAKYDATAIFERLNEAPASAVDYPEMEEGPLAPDLREVQEAWITWRQTYESDEGFTAIVAWHHAKLSPEWSLDEMPDKATFRKGEWSLTLEAMPGASKPRYRRILQWTRDPEVL